MSGHRARSRTGRSLISPAIGSAISARTSPPATTTKPPCDRAEPVHRHRHVGVVHADDADVVAVVADRRGDGAALQPETLDEAAPDIAVDAVPRDHGDLDDVLATIGLTLARP